MNNNLDHIIREGLKADMPHERMSCETEEKILNRISSEMRERKKIMKFKNTKRTILIAAAILALGGISAVAAGKITGLRSGVNVNNISYSCAAEVKNEKRLGQELQVVDSFENGIKLDKGYFISVEGTDENQNVVDTFPSVDLHYNRGLSLSIDKIPSGETSDNFSTVLLNKEINGTSVTISKTDYLFLPPEMEPSAEEAKLQNSGKLVISYGSEKPERKTFTAATWKDGELSYTLHSFEAFSADEMLSMAEELINAK